MHTGYRFGAMRAHLITKANQLKCLGTGRAVDSECGKKAYLQALHGCGWGGATQR